MSTDDERELEELLTALIDDEINPAQQRRLAALIQEDPAARARYLEHCRLHAALAWEHGVLGNMNFPLDLPDSDRTIVPLFTRIGRPLAIAAALALLFALVWRTASVQVRRSAWRSATEVGAVARSVGGELSVAGLALGLSPGEALRVGGYELTRGFIDLQLTNGVAIVVEAPARFDVESASTMVLHSGRLSATVPPSGHGFMIQTPSAEVIDHGTEFGVEVTPGLGSEIHVFAGEVEVKSRTLANESLRLLTDQATRVDEYDGSPAGIRIAPERFLRTFEEPPSTYAKIVRRLKPIMYFRMNPGGNGLVLNDHSGNGLHARIEPGTSDRPLFGPGRFGSALRLRGSRPRSHALVPDYPKTTTGRLSVVAWVRADSRPRWASIAKNWGEGERGQFHFGLFDHSGELEALVRGPGRGGSRVRDREPFPIGVWQHVAFVADGTQLRLYRNGREVARVPHKPIGPPTMRALGIGAKLVGNHPRYPGAPADFWHGRIDELALFNDALDEKTIARLHAAGSPMKPAQVANVVE